MRVFTTEISYNISIMQPDGYTTSDNSTQNSRFSFRKIAIIVFGVLLLLIAGIAAISAARPSDSKIAENFVKLVQKKDTEKSYAMTSTTFKKTTTKEDWSLTVDRIAEHLGGDLSEQEPSGDNNVYVYQPKGSKYLITVGVEDEAGAKKVNFFNSGLIR